MMISKRLETVLRLTEPCGVLADVGCDHGYIAIRAVLDGLADRAIASDVAPGPLEAARRNAEAAGIRDGRLRFVLSDGLQGLDDAGIECIVIAGMGGILISRILTEGGLQRFRGLRQLVLGPQSDLDLVRHTLIDGLGFAIRREACVKDEGKYYFLMDAAPADRSEAYDEAGYMFGRNILPACLPVYREYLLYRRSLLERALEALRSGNGARSADRTLELAKQVELIETALMNAGGLK